MGWFAINATPQRYAIGESIEQVRNDMEIDIHRLMSAKQTIDTKLEQTQMLLAFHRVSSQLGAELQNAMSAQRNFSEMCNGLIDDVNQKISEVDSLVRQFNMPRISRDGRQSGREILEKVNLKGQEATEIQIKSTTAYMAATNSRNFSALQAEAQPHYSSGMLFQRE